MVKINGETAALVAAQLAQAWAAHTPRSTGSPDGRRKHIMDAFDFYLEAVTKSAADVGFDYEPGSTS